MIENLMILKGGKDCVLQLEQYSGISFRNVYNISFEAHQFSSGLLFGALEKNMKEVLPDNIPNPETDSAFPNLYFYFIVINLKKLKFKFIIIFLFQLIRRVSHNSLPF